MIFSSFGIRESPKNWFVSIKEKFDKEDKGKDLKNKGAIMERKREEKKVERDGRRF